MDVRDMKAGLRRVSAVMSLVASATLARGDEPKPVIQTVTLSTRDAPMIELTNHGPVGGNVVVQWTFIGPGPRDTGDALYGFCFPRNPARGDPTATPILFVLDLETGAFREVFHTGAFPGQAGAAPSAPGPAADDDLLNPAGQDALGDLDSPLGQPARRVTKWEWGRPTCAATGPGRAVTIGADDGQVVRYDPAAGLFHEVMKAGQQRCVRVAVDQDGLWVITEPGDRIWRQDELGTETWLPGDADAPTFPAIPQPKRDYTLREDFDHEPPSVRVREPGEPERHLEFNYSKATADYLRYMILSPDGTRVLGSAVPNSFWWSFPVDCKGRLKRHGMDYATGVMLAVGDRVYAHGYPFNKFMRWDPDAPWTLDWDYADDTTYSPHYTPWGRQDTNPAAVCRFRALRNTNVRRGMGFALGADGRIYMGGRDHAIDLDWVEPDGRIDYPLRFAGCLYWYDPGDHSIGFEVGDDRIFEHLEVLDVCAALRGRYICLASMADAIPMAPPFPDLERGYLHVWDTQTRRFVHRSSPTHAKVRFIEEGAEGLVAVYTDSWDGYEDGWPKGLARASQMVIFDVRAMATARILRLPWHDFHSAYSVPFIYRGPDDRVYFFGTDEHGTALFRVDTVTGKIDAVARGPGISDSEYGVSVLFTPDRVFFGGTALRSAPIETIVGPAPPGGWKMRAADPPGTESLRHRSPSPEAADVARERESARVAARVAERNQGVPDSVPERIPNLWTPLRQIQWTTADGPAWFSCGDGNTIVCVQPDGEAVRLSVRRVSAFDPTTGAPVATTPILEQTIALGPGARTRHGLHPPDGETMRLFLLAHACPGGVAGALDVEVVQQIVDPDIPNTARFMEPKHPGDRHWYTRETLKAPWAGKHPVRGMLAGAAGAETYGPATPVESTARSTFVAPSPVVELETDEGTELPVP